MKNLSFKTNSWQPNILHHRFTTPWVRRLGRTVAALVFLSPLWALLPTTPAQAAGTWTDLTHGQSFNTPLGIAVDSAGNVFVTNANPPEAVLELAAGTSTWQPVSSNGQAPIVPAGIAVTNAGDIYATDLVYAGIVKYSPQGNTWSAIPSSTQVPLTTPLGIAVDSAGDVFVTNYSSQTPLVDEYLPSGTWKNLSAYPGVTFNEPGGIAVDSAGDVFVTNYGNNTVVELPAGTKKWVNIPDTGVTFNGASGIAVNSAGDLFVASENNNMVAELPAGSTTWKALTGPFNVPSGVAVNGAGQIFVTNVGATTSNAIIEYTPVYHPAPVWVPPTLTPEAVTVGGISGSVVGDLGFNAVTAIQNGSFAGYVEERAAVEAGATFSGEGTNSGYMSAILDGSGVGLQQHVAAIQQGQFAALYQKLGIIPTWTNNTVTIPQGVAALSKAGAPALAIENYLVQLDGFTWTAAQVHAAKGFPISSGT